ncbi:RNA polymerase sigma factor [Niabella beijingensis]|uniref:RNA polymerase sigma factor n=1 Tax=Niabella beijingensis TaxID=2872700 RepID=UPI001CC0526D|nr:sigma-70 family RNA polymerase sigma factor [Niabella beijingensis]MBZ4190563.1 sigma-70 family RNA polymerase sigma factor [Niabella beijingensis]
MLFDHLVSGSEKDLSEIIATYHNRLYAYVNRYVRNPCSTEEILQDTFLTLWEHRHLMDKIPYPEGWLILTGMRKAVDYLRNEKKNPPITSLPDDDDKIPDPKSLIDILSHKETLRHIDNALQQLSPMRRKVMELFINTGMSRKEIGTELGIKDETVKSHLAAARDYITGYLKKRGQLPVVLILWILKIFNND